MHRADGVKLSAVQDVSIEVKARSLPSNHERPMDPKTVNVHDDDSHERPPIPHVVKPGAARADPSRCALHEIGVQRQKLSIVLRKVVAERYRTELVHFSHILGRVELRKGLL